MPRIGDQEATPAKTFKKKPYRPWNLFDEPSTPTPEKSFPDISTTEKSEIVPSTSIMETPSKQIDANWISNGQQLDSNQVAISNQLDTNKISISKQSISNRQQLDSNQVAIRPLIGKQLDTKNLTYKSPIDEVNRLYGSEKKLFFFVLERCLARGQLTSGPITNESLRNLLNSSHGGVKSTIHRLVSKGILSREKGKTGKGGFCSFTLTAQLRDAALEIYKQAEKSLELDTNWIAKQIAKAPCSSSNNIKTTTTEEEIKVTEKLNEAWWDSVDVTPLQSVGFQKLHLQQIILSDLLTIEMIQNSIYAFAFDLEYNNKQSTLKTSPLNYFMGILRSGRPYAPPGNYESPQDIALREYLERQRALKQKRSEMEREASELAFQAWLQDLTDQEKQQILPLSIQAFKAEQPKISILRQHFMNEIWAKERDKIFSSEA